MPELLEALDGATPAAAVPESLARELEEVQAIGGSSHLRGVSELLKWGGGRGQGLLLLCCVVLCCAVLCCVVLCCVVLCCVVLCCVVLCCVVLCCGCEQDADE